MGGSSSHVSGVRPKRRDTRQPTLTEGAASPTDELIHAEAWNISPLKHLTVHLGELLRPVAGGVGRRRAA